MTSPRLHVPDEPVAALVGWRARLVAGASLDEVLLCEGGVATWYWHRWQALARVGLSARGFDAVVGEHARELGLWLRGERTHAAVASSLAGRVMRRLSGAPAPPRPLPTPERPALPVPGAVRPRAQRVASPVAP